MSAYTPLLALLLSLALGLCAGRAQAQELKNGEVSGTLVSLNARASGQKPDVLSLPAGRTFVLLETCTTAAVDLSLVGSSLGRILGAPAGDCRSYDPGVVFESLQTITCEDASGGAFTGECLVTGVLSRQRSRGGAARGRLGISGQ